VIWKTWLLEAASLIQQPDFSTGTIFRKGSAGNRRCLSCSAARLLDLAHRLDYQTGSYPSSGK
jgi:hypothetical protein